MIRTADDVARDNFNRKQQEMFQRTINNVNYILRKNTPPKPKPSKIWKTIKWSFALFGLLFGMTIILSMTWLIKTLIVSLFL